MSRGRVRLSLTLAAATIGLASCGRAPTAISMPDEPTYLACPEPTRGTQSALVGGRKLEIAEPLAKSLVGFTAYAPDESLPPPRPFCTGVLIGKNTVLTAGHCLRATGSEKPDFFVFFGPNPQGATFARVVRRYLHPSAHFDGTVLRMANDLGVVTFEGEAPADTAVAELASAPLFSGQGQGPQKLTVAGFGPGHALPCDERRQAHVAEVDADPLAQDELLSRLDDWYINREEYIALSTDRAGVSGRPGDSGGPVVTIEGDGLTVHAISSLVSWRDDGAREGDPNHLFATQVARYRDWIETAARDAELASDDAFCAIPSAACAQPLALAR